MLEKINQLLTKAVILKKGGGEDKLMKRKEKD